ncbi:helix-turn-helix domain-containing protein [Methylobacterium nodulans]|uniref:HTH cro/C1-type domain-containing protein n=1 Tax=Methylobacterium nodulans (strain LMG 21967 / CNCM I-2342 / ORS 2060) TaxID=460265 RepID=B8IT79_METNO|nr:hypothetical protein Mnod_1977 [Methylobacterium nodulans ORS 2060]
MHRHPHIALAIDIVGSQPKLARAAGISQQQVSKLLHCQRQISAGVAIAIEKATAGKIGRWQLRPDYWDPPDMVAQVGGDTCHM